jgi:exosortase/archaeosortase family protein
VKAILKNTYVKYAFRFLLLAAVLQVAVEIALKAAPLSATLNRWNLVNASVSGGVLETLGFPSSRTGTVIVTSGSAIDVTHECNGLSLIPLLAAAILACPASVFAKTCGITCAMFMVAILNWGRIVSLSILQSKSPMLFFEFHTYVWPAIFIMCEVLLFYAWSYMNMRLPVGYSKASDS